MEYRPLGKTGLNLSVLGFGTSPFGNIYHKHDESSYIDAAHAGIALGINYFDTAPYYGDTVSETVLGKALLTIPRDKYFVGTKVGRYASEWDLTADRAVKSVHESLKRLQLDYIDVIQVHDIEFADLNQVINETLPALRKLRESGLVRHIGVTGLPLKALKHVVERTDVDLILSYCHFNLADSSLLDLLPTLQQREIGLINASALSMGLLTNRGPPAWHPAPQLLKDKAKEAAEFCMKNGHDISQLAVEYCIREKSMATNLIGMCTVQEVEHNVEAAKRAVSPEWSKNEHILAQVQKILEPVHNVTWPSGFPENN